MWVPVWRPYPAAVLLVVIDGFQRIQLEAEVRNASIPLLQLFVKRLR